MNRAKAEAVRHSRRSRLLRIADDMGCIEQPSLFESADRALIPVCREDESAEARAPDGGASALAEPRSGVRYRLRDGRFPLVHRLDHGTWRDENSALQRIVFGYEHPMLRPVPAGSSADEVHERNLQQVGGAQCTIVRLVF
jgi:hypothetical protein